MRSYPSVARALASVTEQMEQHLHEIGPFATWLHETLPALHHVCEIGVRHGGTAALWHQLSRGQVIGVDRVGHDSYARPEFDQLAATMMQKYPRYTFIDGDSHDAATLAAVTRQLDGEPLDLLFLDGDHSYAGVVQDYQDYAPLVRPGGVIAFHDITASPAMQATGHGVWRFWQECQHPRRREFCWGLDWGGIGAMVR